MRTKFSVARCCCRCVPCPSCFGGQAPGLYQLHITQGAFTGNYLLSFDGNCTWSGTSGTRTATLDVQGSPPSIQVSDTAQPGLLARWQWLGGTGDADCLWKGEDGGAWTCQTGTGLADCTGTSIEILGVREARVNAVTDGQLERITDQDGDRITGLVEEDCGEATSTDCDKCVDSRASFYYDVIVQGFVDVGAQPQSKFNGTWKMARQAGPGSCIYEVPPLFETPQITFIFDGTAGGPTFAWFDMTLTVFPYAPWTYRFRYPHPTNNVTGNMDCVGFSDGSWSCTGASPGQSCANQPGATVTVRPSGSAGAMALPLDVKAPLICPECGRLSLKRYWGCKRERTIIERCSCGYKRID